MPDADPSCTSVPFHLHYQYWCLHREESIIRQYAAALRSEGCDSADDFNDLTLDELKEAPFSFKRLHLKKVAKLREQGSAAPAAAAPPVEPSGATGQANVRGRCSLCGLDVLDTQPRIKDPETGLYQHQDCQSSGGAAGAENTAPRSSVIATERAIAEAKTNAAAAAERAEAEVAAIMAAADAARASVIAEAKRLAGESLAAAEKDAEQIAAAARAVDRDTASSASAASGSLPAAFAAKPLLQLGPKTKALLPGGKHAFLSYQWDVQDQVKAIKSLLNDRNVKCWMDIDGGMKSDIYDSMAEGVQGAACVVCFMTQAYQDSANCKLELKFAQQSGVPIIPVMMQADFAAKGWLGILTSGSIWTPMYEKASVLDGVDKLIELAQHVVPGMRGVDDTSDAASEASDNTESFDVGAWGAEMFSLDEMREELGRLREQTDPLAKAGGDKTLSESVLCSLPAMVPVPPQGLLVTAEMENVLAAVLSDTSASQIVRSADAHVHDQLDRG